jgi:hypothetical protein
MQKKFQYVVKELNQPSDKAVRQFHQQINEWMKRLTVSETKLDIAPRGIEHSTQ